MSLLIFEKLEVIILGKSISFLKENPAGRTFKFPARYRDLPDIDFLKKTQLAGLDAEYVAQLDGREEKINRFPMLIRHVVAVLHKVAFPADLQKEAVAKSEALGQVR
jgi:hypothetical protein